MTKKAIDHVKQLHFETYQETATRITALAETGSYRQYFRLKNKQNTVLGVYNTDLRENEAYLSFTNSFLSCNINVPKILKVNNERTCYLVEDLGKTSLYDFTIKNKEKEGLNKDAIKLFKATIDELIKIQHTTINSIDTTYCYPRDSFDRQSILWDLYYFKYYCLKLFRIGIDENGLEDDFNNLAQTLDAIPKEGFLYRDFQSKNVVIKEGKAFFIDFQGGRKGSFYYDLASILYDGNIELEAKDRSILKDYYFSKLKENRPSKEEFEHNFKLFASIRLMQALGAFGLRGVIEKKPNFTQCIPYAVASLHEVFSDEKVGISYPFLKEYSENLKNSSFVKDLIHQ